MSETVISMADVRRIYKMGDTEVQALRGISFNISQGEFVAIMGPSGSGKSTCMNMIGCLDRPSGGIVSICGKETAKMNEKELAELRNKTVGFVFQQYHLIPSLTVAENVMLPLRYQKIEKSERLPLAEAALEKVSLVNRMNHRPHELSGGQKQRVAIARALVTNPKIILADEPTGALDSETGRQVMALFNEINANGTTIVIVTHDPRIGAAVRRCIHIFDGQIKADVVQEPVPFSGNDEQPENKQTVQPVIKRSESAAVSNAVNAASVHAVSGTVHVPQVHAAVRAAQIKSDVQAKKLLEQQAQRMPVASSSFLHKAQQKNDAQDCFIQIAVPQNKMEMSKNGLKENLQKQRFPDV